MKLTTAVPFIELRDVYKRFGENTVLGGVNLTIPKGEITAVIGKSGSGKSVLLKHIIGLMSPDAGSILFNGKEMSRMNVREMRSFRQKVSYMFQDNALFDAMTVSDNIALPISEGKNALPRAEVKERVRTRMDQLEIGGTGHLYPAQLSGGMRKRVALARALVTDPEAVLFDEPTTGLDPVRKAAVHHMISSYQRRFGFTAVVVSHDIPDIFHVAGRVAMLDGKRVIFQDTVERLHQCELPAVRDFITGKES